MRTKVIGIERFFMIGLAMIFLISLAGLTPAAAQDTPTEDPSAVEEPTDSAVIVWREITGAAEGYLTEDSAGNVARVWFYSMGPEETLSGIAHVMLFTWDGTALVNKSDVLQFKIVDGNVVDIVGNYFVLSMDGVLFRISWDTQRVFPSAW